MTERIAIVTDSTAYLPDGYAEESGIGVVPLYVSLGGVSGEEGTEVTPADVAKALSERSGPVTTSRPSPAHFRDAYRAMLDAGATGIVSVHLSRELSGTWASACRAAEKFGDGTTVRVVDSRSAAMGLGFCVLAANEAAQSGGGLDRVHDVAQRLAGRTTTLFYVDTLEHLRRGGRIGAAQALLGTALSVKPILHVNEGRIVPLEKVRTASRGVARLADLAVRAAADTEVDIAVHHLATPERASLLADRLRERLPWLRRLLTCEVGGVVGAHVGPGVLGVVVAPVDQP